MRTTDAHVCILKFLPAKSSRNYWLFTFFFFFLMVHNIDIILLLLFFFLLTAARVLNWGWFTLL